MTGLSRSLEHSDIDKDKFLRISGRNAEERTLFEPCFQKNQRQPEKSSNFPREEVENKEEILKITMKSTRGRVITNATRKERPSSSVPPGLSDPYNVSDESKVSKQIRRLMREDNFERFHKGVQILQESILLPENGKYIRRNLETLLNAMLDLSHAAPGLENRQQVAFSIGKAGYISEHDLGVYLDWCLDRFKTEISDKGRLTIIESIIELLRLENEAPQLKNPDERLIVTVQQILEFTEATELVKPVVQAILLLLELDIPSFSKYFHDMVDILVGWYVEPKQPKHICQTIDEALNRMGPFWLADKQATITLLSQFIEDTTNLAVVDTESDLERRRLLLFVRVFNTVVNSVINNLHMVTGADFFGTQFLNTSITRMIDISLEILSCDTTDEELLIYTNDTAAGLLQFLQLKSQNLSTHILSYVKNQLPTTENLPFWTLISYLRLFASVVTNISIITQEDIHSWLSPNSPLLSIRFLPHTEVVKASLTLYQSLLKVKDVQVLEEVYKLILNDFQVSLQSLGSTFNWVQGDSFSEEKYRKGNGELVALFCINALSQLASESNSLIVMWALKPSIFEVMDAILLDENLINYKQSILLAAIKVLKSHCRNHSQFLISSSLISVKPVGMGGVSNHSPTSEYFQKTIETVTTLLIKSLPMDTRQYLLAWSVDILTASVPYIKNLKGNHDIEKLVDATLESVKYNDKGIVMTFADFAEALFHSAVVLQDLDQHRLAVEISLLFTAYSDEAIRRRFHDILVRYPPLFLEFTLRQLTTKCSQKYSHAKRLLMTKVSSVTLPTVYFNSVTMYILKGTAIPEQPWLSNIFSICQENSLEIKQRMWCEKNDILMTEWSLWEAANYCINNKLRTPFGKPNETFMAIEMAVKYLASEGDSKSDPLAKTLSLLKLNEPLKDSLIYSCKQNQRVSFLVSFVDHLERALYNGYEGTALVLPPPAKAIRLFFRTNRSTCEEWLLRLRRVIAPLALEVGMWESAYRHGFYWLHHMISKNLETHPDFEKAIICCVESLRRRNDSLSILGLYNWLSSGIGYHCDWIQSIFLISSGKLEDGVKSIVVDISVLGERIKNTTEKSQLDKLETNITYLNQQIEQCQYNLGSWEGIENKNTNLSHLAKASLLFNAGLYPECVKALDSIKTGSASWRYSNIELEVQKEVMKAASLLGEGDTNFNDVLEAVMKFGEVELNRENFDGSFEVLHFLKKLEGVHQQQPVVNYPMSPTIDESVMRTCAKGLGSVKWLRLLTKLTGDHFLISELSSLESTMLKLAKKEKNFELARSLICEHVKREMGLRTVADSGTLALLITLMTNCPSSQRKADILLQGTKVLYESGEIVPSVTLLSQTCIELRRHILSFGISNMLRLESALEVEEASIKNIYISSLIQLSKWLGSNKHLLNSGNTYMQEAMASLIGGLPTVQLIGQMDEGDACIGQILQAGIRDVQENAKAWKRYGDWCYGHGIRVSSSSDLTILNDQDMKAVSAEIESLPANENAEILQVLSKPHTLDYKSNVLSSDYVQCKLSSFESFKANPNILEAVVNIWELARNRVFGYYRQAVGSYFEFLKLDDQPSAFKTSQAENITATLRILDMLVKHPVEMNSVFELSVKSTSAASWKRITPQLLARLAYPDSIVRKNLSDLLLKIGESHPELLVFPAVVGAEAVLDSRSSKKDTGLLRDLLSQSSGNGDELDVATTFEEVEEEELVEEEQNEDCSAMKSSFDLILDAFSREVPEMLGEVQLLTQELQRIVLLWDELWLTTLNQYHSQIVKNINRLEFEMDKLKMNPSLTKQQTEVLGRKKYDIIFKPILLVFETLHSVSSSPPSTPHEKSFHEKYNSIIEQGLNNMRSPVDVWNPIMAWNPFKQLLSSLQARSQRKNASQLRLKDISPRLAELKNTKIVLPGQTTVTISSLDDLVLVLPTKTRPKKLIFKGSDGVNYGYLFKGLEDLHLDERVMQILEITNTMLASSKVKFANPAEYRARHYAVVPLGARSGLIQWVPDVTPLFGLYKRWQQREAAATQSKTGFNPGAVTVHRPSELFYAKLGSFLLPEGISPTPEHRKEWPLSILVKVLTELMKETPSDLLAREIWCNSPSSRDWWRATQNFSRYTAVMSMIGHVIGLGDRHLDNILVNLSTGEVVHIDYNVCFEKGLQLRVPEVVPFRLTQNIQTALGPTGIEGTFRHSCEHVMSVLRDGKETLLTLLEAFLYDPLIDWLADVDHGYAGIFHCISPAIAKKFQKEKRDLNRELTHTMFDVRIAEIESDWFENKEETINLLPKLLETLEIWIENHSSIERHEDSIQELQQAMSLVKEAEVNSDHALYSIYPSYMQYKVVLDEEQNVKKLLQEKLQNLNEWLEIEEESMNSIRGPDAASWGEILKVLEELCNESSVSGFLAATDFLSKAGQAGMVAQCEQAEGKVRGAVQKCLSTCRSMFELLMHYSNICSMYPLETRQNHRTYKHKEWIEALTERIDMERYRAIIKSFEAEFRSNAGDLLLSQSALSVAQAMRNGSSEISARLQTLQTMNLQDEIEASGLELAKAKSNLEHVIVGSNGKSFNMTAIGIVLSTLSGINRKSLNLEATISNFMDIGLGNTASFVVQSQCSIDEMLIQTVVSKEILSSVQSILNVDRNIELTEVVDQQILALRSIEEMFSKCRSVVLPEALRRCQMGDSSVYAVYNRLSDIVDSCTIPISELTDVLEVHLRYKVMEMESPVTPLVNNVASLRAKFSAMLEEISKEEITQGEMLLLGLNGLCIKAENLGLSAITSLLGFYEGSPVAWKKIDIVREAKTIAPPFFSPGPRDVLWDLVFVQRLKAIHQTLALCIENGLAFRLPSIGHIGPEIRDLLEKSRLQPICHTFTELEFPIRKYGLEVLRRQLFGIASIATTYSACQAAEHMGFNLNQFIGKREVGADSTISFDQISQAVIEDASGGTKAMSSSLLAHGVGHVATLEVEVRKYEALRNYEKAVEADRAALAQWEASSAAFHWLYEDVLDNPAISSISAAEFQSRTTFLHEMTRIQKQLKVIPTKVGEVLEQITGLGASVEQRLKWAAGANPAVAEQLEEFSTKYNRATDLLKEVITLTNSMNIATKGVVHFESMRTRTKEAIGKDAEFRDLIEKCKEVCLLGESCPTHLTTAEISLLRLVPPDRPIDMTWLTKADSVVSNSLRKARERLNEMNLALQESVDRVRSDATHLRENVNDHHNVISSMRALLKQMGKTETNVQQYLLEYKSYSELCSIVIKNLTSDLDLQKVKSAKEALESMERKIADIYDLLPKLTLPDAQDHSHTSRVDKKDKGGVKPDVKDVHAGRNPVAVTVWQRVKLKLEGRETDLEKPLTIKEQVDSVIKDSTNLENLALLYEGWTPWV